MKDRIAHIMRAQNLKASDFAELLGVQPSGVSHILSGRNQPSLDFIKKIKENFPEYNLDWIIFGKGPMTTSAPFNDPTPISPVSSPSTMPSANNEVLQFDFSPEQPASVPDPASDSRPSSPPSPVAAITDKVKSVLVLYEDGSFETYTPRL